MWVSDFSNELRSWDPSQADKLRHPLVSAQMWNYNQGLRLPLSRDLAPLFSKAFFCPWPWGSSLALSLPFQSLGRHTLLADGLGNTSLCLIPPPPSSFSSLLYRWGKVLSPLSNEHRMESRSLNSSGCCSLCYLKPPSPHQRKILVTRHSKDM